MGGEYCIAESCSRATRQVQTRFRMQGYGASQAIRIAGNRAHPNPSDRTTVSEVLEQTFPTTPRKASPLKGGNSDSPQEQTLPRTLLFRPGEGRTRRGTERGNARQ